MLKITDDEISRWRNEISQGEKFRNDNFGRYEYNQCEKAGENIDYFETGISGKLLKEYNPEFSIATINIIHPIVKNVVPTLSWRNPYITATPKRIEDEQSAPYAAACLNYYYDELDVKSVNRQVVFDTYLLGMGICKIGYATQFGSDIPDDNLEKTREKEKTRGILEMLGLRKPKPEEKRSIDKRNVSSRSIWQAGHPVKENIELNEYIRSESPYVIWVNPFDFVIDPMANSIHNARWVCQRITKRLSDVKSNTNYSNTSKLSGSSVSENLTKDISETQIDNFKTINLYEVHYKTDKGINVLTLAKDGEFKALRHESSIYEIDGFQYEVLYFNKHNHKLYAKSDIDIIKGLQDRMSSTFDSILDQIDKYVPKIFVDETALTDQGQRALRDGNVGAIVNCNKNPNDVVKEASFTQVKADMTLFIDKILEVILFETGLTRAQLMGMTNAQTATEAQIGQAGQNLRMSDKFDLVAEFSNRQVRKLWQVIQQFVDLEEIQLISGEGAIDQTTGMPKYDWMKPIDSELKEKLIKGEYSFKIDVSSIEKPDLPVLRTQVERIGGLLAQQGVMQAFQMQGYKINLAEFGKKYLELFPYVFTDVGKIIQPIGPESTGLISPQMPQAGTAGPNMNSQRSPQPPNIADILSGQAGEKGQGVGIA